MRPHAYRFDIQEIGSDSAEWYLVWFPDLLGVVTIGNDIARTVERAHDLARVWLEDAMRYGRVPTTRKN